MTPPLKGGVIIRPTPVKQESRGECVFADTEKITDRTAENLLNGDGDMTDFYEDTTMLGWLATVVCCASVVQIISVLRQAWKSINLRNLQNKLLFKDKMGFTSH